MACGTPVVASKTGVLKFWQEFPKWAFKPGDEQDLASALGRTICGEIEILNGVKDAESMF